WPRRSCSRSSGPARSSSSTSRTTRSSSGPSKASSPRRSSWPAPAQATNQDHHLKLAAVLYRTGTPLQRVRVCALVAALVLSACNVKVDVRVTSVANGSGTVRVTATLDKMAVAQAGTLAVDDLKQAGWSVTATDTRDGGRTYTATHR